MAEAITHMASAIEALQEMAHRLDQEAEGM